MKIFKAFLFACMTCAPAVYAESGYISICSFNIAELGSSTPNKDHRAIADMIDDFDLIVIEEVQDNGGEAHISAIVDSMNVNLSSDSSFSYLVISGAGRGFPGNEGYAFIYQQPVELDSSYEPPFGLKKTDVIYGRIPGWAYFKAVNFDFMVVGVHLHWSDLDKRMIEVADLLQWMKEYSDKPDSEEKDLIIVGDTNRFGEYSDTKIKNGETAFHQLLKDPALGIKYRLLFCEYLPAMDTKEAPDNAGSTTVSNNNNMIYDQIFIASGAFREFGNAKGVLGMNIGIVDFDSALEDSGMDYDTIVDRVSDHRPIYAKFRTDLPDDDGIITKVENETGAKSFELLQNYPNPFNPSTTIEFRLSEGCRLKLSIHNVCGQEIVVLEEGKFYPGNYAVKWDAGGLPSGIYLCKIETGGYRKVQKLLLLK